MRNVLILQDWNQVLWVWLCLTLWRWQACSSGASGRAQRLRTWWEPLCLNAILFKIVCTHVCSCFVSLFFPLMKTIENVSVHVFLYRTIAEFLQFLFLCRWHQWREWLSTPSWRVKHPGRRTSSRRMIGPRQAPSPSTESTSRTAPAILWSWRTWLSSSPPEKRFLSLLPPVHAQWSAQPVTQADTQPGQEARCDSFFVWHYFRINYWRDTILCCWIFRTIPFVIHGIHIM